MTLYLIAERILRLYEGGNISDDSPLKIEDVKHLVVDQINRMLKVEAISLNRQLGDNAPSNLVIATYTGVTVEVYKTTQSRATLPAIPVSLPKGMGVWWVSSDADDATNQDQFVPLQNSQWSLIKDFSPMTSLGKVLGNFVYEIEGKYIIFPVDITGDVTDVMIKLLVTDISTLGNFDLLPIPADYTDEVVRECLKILGVVPENTDVVNDANPQA